MGAKENADEERKNLEYEIRSLEKEMDVVLFERNTRHCRLTMAGQTFYYDAVQLLSFSHHAVKKAQDIHNTNKSHFRVGIRKLSDYDLFAQFVEKFYEEYPTTKGNYTLNGFMFTLVGLYDYYKVTGNELAKELYDDGIETLKEIREKSKSTKSKK